MRVVDIITHARDGPVPLHFTFRRGQKGGAVTVDNSASGINQGQAVGNGVLAETVLFSYQSGGLLDDGAQVADILGDEFSAGRGKSDLVTGRRECGVHSLVGDARVVRVALLARIASKNAAGVVEG